MADIRFYDFDFNLIRILPPFAEEIGYKAIDTEQIFNGSGSLEINFFDPVLKKLVEKHEANIIIKWRDFCGVLTSYRWTDKEYKLTGTHLNGLFNRAVIPAIKKTDDNGETIADTVCNILNSALENIDWINYSDLSSLTTEVIYGTDKPEKADTFIQGLFDISGCGYEIKADFRNKSFIFEPILPVLSSLMLSESNLNAYEFETTYIGKSEAFGGWYKSGDEWKYITRDETKAGIHKIDTVLSAETEADAKNELAQCKPEFEILATTRNIEYGKDYKIGDILRVQHDGKTDKRLVTGVNRWEEGGYHESPIMSE